MTQCFTTQFNSPFNVTDNLFSEPPPPPLLFLVFSDLYKTSFELSDQLHFRTFLSSSHRVSASRSFNFKSKKLYFISIMRRSLQRPCPHLVFSTIPVLFIYLFSIHVCFLFIFIVFFFLKKKHQKLHVGA